MSASMEQDRPNLAGSAAPHGEDAVELSGADAAPDPHARLLRRRRQAIGTIAIGFALLLGAILLQGGLVLQTQHLIHAMQDARAVQLAASKVMDSLLNAESGQRGFLITADERYLANYTGAAEKLPDQIATLERLGGAPGNPAAPALIGRIARLSRQKLLELNETLALASRGDREKALALVRSGLGENSMNNIRGDMRLLQNSLDGPLGEKRLALDALQSWLMVGVLGAMVAACALAALLIRSSRRQLRALERREDSLRRLAARLERRVAQRTGSLAEANLRFHVALRASGVTVYTQDRQLRYTWISKGVLGLTAEQFIGRLEQDILPAASRAIATPAKLAVLWTGEPGRIEIPIEVDGARRWFDVTIDAQRDADGAIVGLVCASVDITEQKARENHIRLLMRELTHRSKNLLTVVDAIARQTAAGSDGVADFIARFGARLHSLAGSHDQLIEENWQGAWMRELIRTQLGHYFDRDASAISIEGPRLRVEPEGAQHIGLAFHELATNAAKYGALSAPSGRVRIAWDVEQDENGDPVCRMTWEESGGPPVRAPGRRGLGQVVIERTVARALGGTVSLDFAPAGLRWTLVFPADRVTALVSEPAD